MDGILLVTSGLPWSVCRQHWWNCLEAPGQSWLVPVVKTGRRTTAAQNCSLVGAEDTVAPTSLAPQDAMPSGGLELSVSGQLGKDDSFSCLLRENSNAMWGSPGRGRVFGSALSLSSCRAVRHHLRILASRDLSTQVPEDCLCCQWYLGLPCVYPRTVCH